jgi:hypothetical protein
LKVESVNGFSGHSDRKQIFNYIHRVSPKPERILVGHGEKSKSLDLAAAFRRRYKLDARVPAVLETVKLR